MIAMFMVCGLVGELTLSLWPNSFRHWFPRDMYRNDTDARIAYALSPNVKATVDTPFFTFDVTTNSLGFRGPELSRDPKIRTIGVFGDSFSFGQGVSDQYSYPEVLRGKLNQAQVMNTGVYDYRPSQSFLTYERVSQEWPLDTVIIQLCYNDFEDQEGPIKRAVHQGYLNPSPPTSMWGEIKNFLLLHSEIASRLRVLIYAFKAGASRRPDFLAPDFEVRRKDDLQSTKVVLKRWITMARSKGQKVIVIYIPHEWQIDPDATPHVGRWEADADVVDPNAAHRWIAPFMAQFPEVNFVNFAPIFRDHYRRGGKTVFIPFDFHLNELGNQMVAQTLKPIL